MIIAISGVPGTGKSSSAKELSKLIKVPVVENKNLNVSYEYDKARKCKILDPEDVARFLSSKFDLKHQDVIFSSTLSHLLPKSMVKMCFVLRCSPDVLTRRLKRRRYSKSKINENVEAELIDLILIEALKKGHKVHEIDTTNKSPKEVALEMKRVLEGKKKPTYGKINFLKRFIEK